MRFRLCLIGLLSVALSISSSIGIAAETLGSRVVLNIEPTKEYPRNSEGAFITLKNGQTLFMYTQYYGGSEDGSPARIVAITSDDGGRTWNLKPRVVVENRGKMNVMSVSLVRLKKSGNIALFYMVKNSFNDCRPWMQISSDEAQTWSEPRLIINAPGYFVLHNDRVVQLSNGRLVVPIGFHRMKGSDPNSYYSFDYRAIAFWYISDDEGKTWKEANTWWAIPVQSETGLQEPGVIELADGYAFGWARTDQGMQYGFMTTDWGNNWSAPYPTTLISPKSPASIKRIPGTALLLSIYNDHSGLFRFHKDRRAPLVAAVSNDGGKTWPLRKLLEDDLSGWYCYTAIHFVDDTVLIAYCAGDSIVGGLNRLRIRLFSRDWLIQ